MPAPLVTRYLFPLLSFAVSRRIIRFSARPARLTAPRTPRSTDALISASSVSSRARVKNNSNSPSGSCMKSLSACTSSTVGVACTLPPAPPPPSASAGCCCCCSSLACFPRRDDDDASHYLIFSALTALPPRMTATFLALFSPYLFFFFQKGDFVCVCV